MKLLLKLSMILYTAMALPMEEGSQSLHDLPGHAMQQVVDHLELADRANAQMVSKNMKTKMEHVTPILSTDLSKALKNECGDLTGPLLRAVSGKDNPNVDISKATQQCWDLFEQQVCKNKNNRNLSPILVYGWNYVPKVSCPIDLKMHNYNDESILKSFADALKYGTPFPKVELRYNYQYKDNYKEILEQLGKHTALKAFGIKSGSYEIDDSLKEFLSTKTSSDLEELEIRDAYVYIGSFPRKVIESITEQDMSCNLKSLAMHTIRLDNNLGVKLERFLQKCLETNLEKLDLRISANAPTNVMHFSNTKEAKLKHLTLRFDHLESFGFGMINNIVKTTKDLERLELSIWTNGQSLDLSNDENFKEFLGLLKSQKNLKYFMLDGDYLTDDNVAKVIDAVPNSVTNLKIRSYNLGKEQLQPLIELLQRNRNLDIIGTFYIEVPEELSTLLGSAIAESSLKQVDLTGFKTTSKGIKNIYKELAKSKTLEILEDRHIKENIGAWEGVWHILEHGSLKKLTFAYWVNSFSDEEFTRTLDALSKTKINSMTLMLNSLSDENLSLLQDKLQRDGNDKLELRIVSSGYTIDRFDQVADALRKQNVILTR